MTSESSSRPENAVAGVMSSSTANFSTRMFTMRSAMASMTAFHEWVGPPDGGWSSME